MVWMILASAWRNQRDDSLAGTAIAHRFTRVRCRRLSEWKHGAVQEEYGRRVFRPGVAVEDVQVAGLDRPVGHFRRLGHGIYRVRVEESVSAR